MNEEAAADECPKHILTDIRLLPPRAFLEAKSLNEMAAEVYRLLRFLASEPLCGRGYFCWRLFTFEEKPSHSMEQKSQTKCSQLRCKDLKVIAELARNFERFVRIVDGFSILLGQCFFFKRPFVSGLRKLSGNARGWWLVVNVSYQVYYIYV